MSIYVNPGCMGHEHAHLRFSFFWSLGPGNGGGERDILSFTFPLHVFVVWNIDVFSVQSEVVSSIEVALLIADDHKVTECGLSNSSVHFGAQVSRSMLPFPHTYPKCLRLPSFVLAEQRVKVRTRAEISQEQRVGHGCWDNKGSGHGNVMHI